MTQLNETHVGKTVASCEVPPKHGVVRVVREKVALVKWHTQYGTLIPTKIRKQEFVELRNLTLLGY